MTSRTKLQIVPWPESLLHFIDDLKPSQAQFFSETKFDSGDVARHATSTPFPILRAFVQLSEVDWMTLQSMVAQPRGTHFSIVDFSTGEERFVTFLEPPNLIKSSKSYTVDSQTTASSATYDVEFVLQDRTKTINEAKSAGVKFDR